MASAGHTSKYDQFENRIRGREVNSDQTVNLYRMWAMRFESWRPRDEPSEAMLRDFDTLLHEETRTDYPWENHRGRPAPDAYAHASRVQAISALKLWARIQYGVTIETVPQDIVFGEPEPFDPHYLPPEEIDSVIEGADDACSNGGCKAAIALGYDAIMRGAELTAVRRQDVDPDAGTVYVRSVKGSNRATISLGDRASNLLAAHVEKYPDRDRLFRNAYDRAWKPQAWNNHFRRAHHEAGFHAFARHSPIVNRLNDGQPFGEVYRRARHKHPEMTTRYARLVGVEPPEWASD